MPSDWNNNYVKYFFFPFKRSIWIAISNSNFARKKNPFKSFLYYFVYTISLETFKVFFFLYTTESLGNILWKHLKFECEKERSHCQAHNYNCRNLPFPKQAQNFCTNTCHILIICLAFWIMYHVKILDITICRLLFINMYKFFGRSKSIVNINIFIFFIKSFLWISILQK